MNLAETLAQLPDDLEVVLRRKGGSVSYTDAAANWLTEPNLNEHFELAQEIVLPNTPQAGEFELSAGDHIFTIPDHVESIWGEGDNSLWARGEPLMIYGPTGIGKTTLAGRLLLSMIGLDDTEILNYPVQPLPNGTTALYIAADRPRQAMRSLRRMIPETAASVVRERLRIEHQRQLWASEKDPEQLLRAAQQANAAIIFIDSAKDLAGGALKDEAAGKALMDTIQICIANDVEICLLHHPRKTVQDGGGVTKQREFTLDDVYGSTWLTAGMGSVLLVAGKPGTGQFHLEQLKAPANFITPMDVAVNYDTGEIGRRAVRDLEWFIDNAPGPVTIRQVTAFEYGLAEDEFDSKDARYKQTERDLDRLSQQGILDRHEGRPVTYSWRGGFGRIRLVGKEDAE